MLLEILNCFIHSFIYMYNDFVGTFDYTSFHICTYHSFFFKVAATTQTAQTTQTIFRSNCVRRFLGLIFSNSIRNKYGLKT